MRVLAFGEILWDIIEGNEHLGGAPFNFAAHVAQCGNNAFIASRLGSDPLGRRAFNRSQEHGVWMARSFNGMIHTLQVLWMLN
jgi:fructokinase